MLEKDKLLIARCVLGIDAEHTITVNYGHGDSDCGLVRYLIVKSSTGQNVFSGSMERGVWMANILNYVSKMAFESVTLKDLCA